MKLYKFYKGDQYDGREALVLANSIQSAKVIISDTFHCFVFDSEQEAENAGYSLESNEVFILYKEYDLDSEGLIN